ncbi:MAG: hypothetical protein KR126chlam2_00084 [Chlamydiae bacterium]|nr:hypothetical protein [Chlamydiota bacterium]
MTKDERFLREIYKKLQAGEETVNPFDIGHDLSFTNHQIINILRGLMQANLVKRFTSEEVALTPRGQEVAVTLVGG